MSSTNSTKPLRQPPCWRIADPDDELSVRTVRCNRVQYELLRSVAPSPQNKIDDECSRLAVRMGLPEYVVPNWTETGYYLGLYPALAEFFATGWFTLRHISTVMDDLACVSEGNRAEVEAQVIAALQPTRPQQHMMSVRTAHRRVKKIVEAIQPDAAPLDPDEVRTKEGVTEAKATLKIDTRQDKRTVAVLDMPHMEGVMVEKIVRAAARKHQCTLVEAMLRLICGQAKVNVTLNLYKNTADPTQDIFAEGGWLARRPGTSGWNRLHTLPHLVSPKRRDTSPRKQSRPQ